MFRQKTHIEFPSSLVKCQMFWLNSSIMNFFLCCYCTRYYIMGRKACYESLSTGWVRCPEDHYKQHPGLQNPQGTMEQTQEIKRQRWGSTDVFGGKIGHRDDKSRREEQGSWGGGWGGGPDVLCSLLWRQFNCSRHFRFAAVNCWYGNGRVLWKKKRLFKMRSLVDRPKWKLHWMGALILPDINIHFMTLLSHCPHPVLTQRAHYYQWRGGWSSQTLIWALSEGITVRTLPQCEWLETYHKQGGAGC